MFISPAVLEEIRRGDSQAIKARESVIPECSILETNDTIDSLTQMFLQTQSVPKNSEMDASHIAYAAVYDMDFLITWNQKHIATDKKRKMIEAIIDEFGFKPPQLLTPERHLLYEGIDYEE